MIRAGDALSGSGSNPGGATAETSCYGSAGAAGYARPRCQKQVLLMLSRFRRTVLKWQR